MEYGRYEVRRVDTRETDGVVRHDLVLWWDGRKLLKASNVSSRLDMDYSVYPPFSEADVDEVRSDFSCDSFLAFPAGSDPLRDGVLSLAHLFKTHQTMSLAMETGLVIEARGKVIHLPYATDPNTELHPMEMVNLIYRDARVLNPDGPLAASKLFVEKLRDNALASARAPEARSYTP